MKNGDTALKRNVEAELTKTNTSSSRKKYLTLQTVTALIPARGWAAGAENHPKLPVWATG